MAQVVVSRPRRGQNGPHHTKLGPLGERALAALTFINDELAAGRPFPTVLRLQKALGCTRRQHVLGILDVLVRHGRLTCRYTAAGDAYGWSLSK